MHQRISRRTDVKRATATLSTLAAALLACAAPGAHAGSTIELGADTTLDYTFTLSYGSSACAPAHRAAISSRRRTSTATTATATSRRTS